MSNPNYQKKYKKSYNDKNKIVTFPLSIAFHDELKRRAFYLDLKTNSYAKSIITTFNILFNIMLIFLDIISYYILYHSNYLTGKHHFQPEGMKTPDVPGSSSTNRNFVSIP